MLQSTFTSLRFNAACPHLPAVPIVYCAERINRLAAQHWRAFAKQNYFDPQAGLWLWGRPPVSWHGAVGAACMCRCCWAAVLCGPCRCRPSAAAPAAAAAVPPAAAAAAAAAATLHCCHHCSWVLHMPTLPAALILRSPRLSCLQGIFLSAVLSAPLLLVMFIILVSQESVLVCCRRPSVVWFAPTTSSRGLGPANAQPQASKPITTFVLCMVCDSLHPFISGQLPHHHLRAAGPHEAQRARVQSPAAPPRRDRGSSSSRQWWRQRRRGRQRGKRAGVCGWGGKEGAVMHLKTPMQQMGCFYVRV